MRSRTFMHVSLWQDFAHRLILLRADKPGDRHQAIPEPPGTARAIAVGERGVVPKNGEVWSHDYDSWPVAGV
jgi:hypothetical protein